MGPGDASGRGSGRIISSHESDRDVMKEEHTLIIVSINVVEGRGNVRVLSENGASKRSKPKWSEVYLRHFLPTANER